MKSNHDIFKNIKSSIKTGQIDGKKELIFNNGIGVLQKRAAFHVLPE